MGNCCGSQRVEYKEKQRQKYSKQISIHEQSIYRYYKMESQPINESNFKQRYLAVHNFSNQYRTILVNSIVNKLDEKFKIINNFETALTLNHPNIIQTYELYLNDGQYLTVQSYCGSNDLKSILQKQRLSETQAHYIFIKLVSALSYLNYQNYLLTNLRSENIVVKNIDQDYKQIEVYIMNLDKLVQIDEFYKIEKSVDETNDSIKEKVRRLTEKIEIQEDDLWYISPESIEGKHSSKSDIWSLGIILYEMLTGEHPFQNSHDLKNCVTKAKYTMPDHLFQNISIQAQDLISRLITYNPRKRLSTNQILKHKWAIKKSQSLVQIQVNMESSILQKILKYIRQNPIQSTILEFIVQNVCDSNIKIKALQLFNQIDLDKNGLIDRYELSQGQILIIKEDADIQTSRVFAQFNLNKDGHIDYNQLLLAILESKDIISYRNINTVWSLLNRNFDSFITVQEFASIGFSEKVQLVFI